MIGQSPSIDICTKCGVLWQDCDCFKKLQATIYPPDFSTVTEFEKKIADFFGAPYAVAVDSCTHGLELCLRYKGCREMWSPVNTYISVPMLAAKLGITLNWWPSGSVWGSYYDIQDNILDAAVFWKKHGYAEVAEQLDTPLYMCLSFQYQKHLSLGRGGMILTNSEEGAKQLKKMSYDGRLPGIPWREQNIDTMGYHYYMTPDTAAEGLRKLPEAIATPPRQWTVNDWPDISKFKVFNP